MNQADNCHHDEATIARARTGEGRDEHLFAWRQSRYLYRSTQMLTAECDTRIEATLQAWTDREPLTPPDRQPPPAKPKHRGQKKGTPDFDAQRLLEQKVGVDLTRITGIDGHTALKIISETGTDMSRWPTEKHFASCLAPCPIPRPRWELRTVRELTVELSLIAPRSERWIAERSTTIISRTVLTCAG